MEQRKKLIEVALPLEAINEASAREKSIRHGHPSTLHLWWARRPLAAARAVIFAQMVDDPSGYVDELQADPVKRAAAEKELKKRQAEYTAKQKLAKTAAVPEPEPTLDGVLAELERKRLFAIIEDMVRWENTTNEAVLNKARTEIWSSWKRACKENAGHPRADELFNSDKLPGFHDPFAGGGALPLEAQRLGLEAHASDLNPVAVLINKAMIEIPPRFAGMPPVNPEERREWRGERKEAGGERKEAGGERKEAGEERKEGRRGKGGALSGLDCVAEGDGGGARGLSAGSGSAQGRALRDAVPIDAGSRIDTGEHRGRLDAGIKTGEKPVPCDSPGLAGGSRDASHAVRTGGVGSGGGDRDASCSIGRGQPDADGYAPKESGVTRPSGLASHSSQLFSREWRGAQGLAEDVRYYGQWMRDEAEKRIGHLYPKAEITEDLVRERPDLKSYLGKKLTVIAWIWARTVKSPNPAFKDVDVPLASTFMLSTKKGKEAYVEVEKRGERSEKRDQRSEKGGKASADLPPSSLLTPPSSLLTPPSSLLPSPYRFTVKVGKPRDVESANRGTKSGGSHSPFLCMLSGTPISFEYLRKEARAGRFGAQLMAVVVEGDRGRVYLSPCAEMEATARKAKPEWKPDVEICHWPGRTNVVEYGLTTFGDLFTPRQLVALTTFSDLVQEAREQIKRDGIAAGLPDDDTPLRDGGMGALAYAEAVGVYLAFAVNRVADKSTSLAWWMAVAEKMAPTFSRQAIPMVWDYAEMNPFCSVTSNFAASYGWVSKAVELFPGAPRALVKQADAHRQPLTEGKTVSTDPPYYDNIGYADLSDFFYIWLRRSMKQVFPELFATLAVPKAEELVASPYRHGSKEKAEKFFLDGMTQAMHCLAEQAHPAFPVTIYYAFKQTETGSAAVSAAKAKSVTETGSAAVSAAKAKSVQDARAPRSTGWETFLEAVMQAGFALTGTWPIRTERSGGLRNLEQNALASSIVLVCRCRGESASLATRGQFMTALKRELPEALRLLQHGNVAPVDLAQAAIGPGMAVFSRHAKVIEPDGSPMRVRTALALINEVLDEFLAQQEGEFDADTRWALTWFQQHGMEEGPYGDAETLSTAKDTSVQGMAEAGFLKARAGKVRLLGRAELDPHWDPTKDTRLTVWEITQHLIHALESEGEAAAARLVRQVGHYAEIARDLAYRLYTVCERKGWAQEAIAYNSLVIAWPEITKLAAGMEMRGGIQAELL